MKTTDCSVELQPDNLKSIFQSLGMKSVNETGKQRKKMKKSSQLTNLCDFFFILLISLSRLVHFWHCGVNISSKIIKKNPSWCQFLKVAAEAFLCACLFPIYLNEFRLFVYIRSKPWCPDAASCYHRHRNRCTFAESSLPQVEHIWWKSEKKSSVELKKVGNLNS